MDASKIETLRLWPSSHFAVADERLAVFQDGTTQPLDCVGLRDLPWSIAIRMLGTDDLNSLVEKYAPKRLPGSDKFRSAGYEFRFEDLSGLTYAPPARAPEVPRVGYRGPSDADIMSLEGNEDLLDEI